MFNTINIVFDSPICKGKEIFMFVGASEGQKIMSADFTLPKIFRKRGVCLFGVVWINRGNMVTANSNQ